MTGKADYTSQEWEQVLQGPPSAGLIVITAQRGGTFRETISMAKAYGEARQQHGQSELLDAIASAKPEIDHTRYHSPEELKEHSLGHIRDAVSLLAAKATAQEASRSTRRSSSTWRKRSPPRTGRAVAARTPSATPSGRLSPRLCPRSASRRRCCRFAPGAAPTPRPRLR